MIVQYGAAAIVAELRALAHPVSVDSIPTSDNQEDHVSMGMTAALMTLDSVERLERIVAYELLCACQALDCDPEQPSATVASIHAAVRERVSPLVEDRPPADDLAALLPLVREGLA
jgi:histidine ammonia-lyase